ncbi:hypothetical protein B0H21DRAFT_690173 [Amylocystis lapponica]|nr:hypothetical protein B0H21DRAFT_690173 [Amylocystis lapponica]
MAQNGEDTPVLSLDLFHPSPDTLTSLIKRLRILTLQLLPVEVPEESINEPTSRVITQQVINAYIAAAGDFLDALPYCLLRARREFMWDANHNPADYGENFGRAIACEVLARRVVHQAPPDRLTTMMSSRYKYREVDGDVSEMASALEVAIDSHCTIFLSSTESQAGQYRKIVSLVDDLWRGQLIQKRNDDHEIDFVPYKAMNYDSFWSHFNPSRLAVPRYLNIFRIVVWFLFLAVYSQAVREPLDKLDPDHSDLDPWEIVMYILALSFSFEDLHKVPSIIYQLLLFISWRAIGFWHIVSFLTDSLLLAAFVLRVLGIVSTGPDSVLLRTRSFQCLSFIAPLIWMSGSHRFDLSKTPILLTCTEIIPIFDGWKFVGTMQICVARMLQESGIFFGLLGLLGIGFIQGLYALDAADGQADHPGEVVHVLIQALLQSPDYNMFAASPAGQALYYLWNLATAVILLNVLISLFSSAYNDVVEDAAAEYLTYFAGKVVGMIRAPDDYAYPAPFNIIEIFLVVPFEFIVSVETYAKINRYVMFVVLFVPLSFIALYEAELDPAKNKWVKDWLSYADEDEADAPEFQDPAVDAADAARGLSISKVPFTELVKAFPDTTRSSEALMLREMAELKAQIAELKSLLVEKSQ